MVLRLEGSHGQKGRAAGCWGGCGALGQRPANGGKGGEVEDCGWVTHAGLRAVEECDSGSLEHSRR